MTKGEEMLKELGFVRKNLGDKKIFKNDKWFENKYLDLIKFDLFEKEYCVEDSFYRFNCVGEAYYISIKLHMAIHQCLIDYGIIKENEE